MKTAFLILLSILIFSVYSLTTSPYLQAGDSAEMAAASISLGIPHQPSYPIYVLLTHTFTTMPIPYFPELVKNPFFPAQDLSLNKSNYLLIYRTGIVSAIFQTTASLFLFLTILQIAKKAEIKETPSVIIIAALSTLLYAFSENIWQHATKPEVFALNNLFAVLLIYLACRWWNSDSTKPPALYLLLFGVAFSHHQTIVLLAPSLITMYLLKRRERSEDIKNIFLTWISYPNDRKFNKAFPYFFCLFFGTIPFILTILYLASRQPFMNWGEVDNLLDVVRALIRADYGTFSAYLTNLQNPTLPLDQLPFFLNHLIEDFSVLILVIFTITFILLYKLYKKISFFLLTVFIFTGPLFLVYANFSLETAFSQATVARFYMLPSLVIPIVLSLALFKLADRINQLADKESTSYLKLGTKFVIIILFGLTAQSVIPNTPLHSNLTYQFIRTAINTTEENALILITGDITTMGMQYIQAVEAEKKNRIIFSPGQLHLDWFEEQIKKRYPDIQIPPPESGKQFTSPRQIIEANWDRHPIYISTEFVDIDKSIQEKYQLWPKGLLLKVEKPGTEYKLEPYLEENTRLYESLKLSEFEKIRSDKYQLETPLITIYSRHFYNLGAIFYTVHRYPDAIREFNRSLTIDPNLPEAYKSLATLFYFTDDYNNKQPQVALNYLNRYIQVQKKLTVEDYQNTQAMIQKIVNDANESVILEQKLLEEEKKKLEEQEKQATNSSGEETTDTILEGENKGEIQSDQSVESDQK